ncbi:MAG TPA: hypothetical protein VHX43_18900 [Xanthobacteraceae bacterium]|nr:hypothetical protein [Xanthobacteraceae bacterium]
MPAKSAIEIGQIIEAGFGGDFGDLARVILWIAQQRRGLFQASLQYMVGETFACLFEKEVHVARRDPEQERDRDCTQAGIAAAALDFAQNCGTTRRAAATLLRQVARVAFRAEKQSCEIVDMRDHKLAKYRVRKFKQTECVDIADQQRENLRTAWNPLRHAGIEVGDFCFKNGAGQPQGDVPRRSSDEHADRMGGARQYSLSLPDHRLTVALLKEAPAIECKA